MAKTATTSDAPGAGAENVAQSRTGAASTAPSAGPDAVGTSPVEARRPPVVSDSTSAPEIPGSEFLGRGIYLSPRQPYELKDFLLMRGTGKSRLLNINADTERAYAIPEDCEVNHSPPLPAGTCIGQTMIEESWSRFSRELTLNANAAVGDQGLSIDATSFHGSNLQSEDDSYYAIRRSFIPFYSVYLPRVNRSVIVKDITNELKTTPIKVPFDPARRSDYAKIFDRFGTHYVKSAWIGGKASLIFVVNKSSGLRKEEIKSGIEVTFAGNKTGAATSSVELQERVRTNSSCSVFGSGGDATALAKLTTLSPTDYNTWVDSVKKNPEVIEFGVAGIWTLLTDHGEAQALKEAYLWESKFSPLNCIVPNKRWLVFTKGNEAFDYARQQDFTETSKGTHTRLYGLYRYLHNGAEPSSRLTLLDYLPELVGPYSDFQQPHAEVVVAVGRAREWKLFLFNWRECLRLDANTGAVDDGYPRGLSEEWPDVDFDRIDAAVSVGPDKIYFFRGAEYIRLDRRDGGWRRGIKDSIKNHWPGIVFDKIDTAAYWGSNKIYFFSEDQYIRYDFGSHRADPGYPRSLSSNYLEDWELFD